MQWKGTLWLKFIIIPIWSQYKEENFVSKDSLIPLERKLKIRFENFSWNTKWQKKFSRQKKVFSTLYYKKNSHAKTDRLKPLKFWPSCVKEKNHALEDHTMYTVQPRKKNKDKGSPWTNLPRACSWLTDWAQTQLIPMANLRKGRPKRKKIMLNIQNFKANPAKKGFILDIIFNIDGSG